MRQKAEIERKMKNDLLHMYFPIPNYVSRSVSLILAQLLAIVFIICTDYMNECIADFADLKCRRSRFPGAPTPTCAKRLRAAAAIVSGPRASSIHSFLADAADICKLVCICIIRFEHVCACMAMYGYV